MILAAITIETPETVNSCVWILRERRPFHVAAAGVLDCLGDDDDFARPGFATEQGYAAYDRERNRAFDPR